MLNILIEKDNKAFITPKGERNLSVISSRNSAIKITRDEKGVPVVQFLPPISEYNPKLLAFKDGEFTPEELSKFKDVEYIVPVNYETAETILGEILPEFATATATTKPAAKAKGKTSSNDADDLV